jgi:hypothetical protein
MPVGVASGWNPVEADAAAGAVFVPPAELSRRLPVGGNGGKSAERWRVSLHVGYRPIADIRHRGRFVGDVRVDVPRAGAGCRHPGVFPDEAAIIYEPPEIVLAGEDCL